MYVVQVNLASSDLKWQYMRASGAGGQGVNKIESRRLAPSSVAPSPAPLPVISLVRGAKMHVEYLYFNFFGQSGVYSILYSMDFFNV